MLSRELRTPIFPKSQLPQTLLSSSILHSALDVKVTTVKKQLTILSIFSISSQLPEYPRAVAFIISNEFCERFNYYGMRGEYLVYPSLVSLVSRYCYSSIYVASDLGAVPDTEAGLQRGDCYGTVPLLHDAGVHISTDGSSNSGRLAGQVQDDIVPIDGLQRRCHDRLDRRNPLSRHAC